MRPAAIIIIHFGGAVRGNVINTIKGRRSNLRVRCARKAREVQTDLYLRVFNDEDYNIATTIRHFRHFYGLYSPCEDIIKALSCD